MEFIGASSAYKTSDANNSLTIPYPQNVTPGDGLYCVKFANRGNTVAPTGWTVVQSTANTTTYKGVANVGESSATFPHNTDGTDLNEISFGMIVAVRDVAEMVTINLEIVPTSLVGEFTFSKIPSSQFSGTVDVFESLLAYNVPNFSPEMLTNAEMANFENKYFEAISFAPSQRSAVYASSIATNADGNVITKRPKITLPTPYSTIALMSIVGGTKSASNGTTSIVQTFDPLWIQAPGYDDNVRATVASGDNIQMQQLKQVFWS